MHSFSVSANLQRLESILFIRHNGQNGFSVAKLFFVKDRVCAYA